MVVSEWHSERCAVLRNVTVTKNIFNVSCCDCSGGREYCSLCTTRMLLHLEMEGVKMENVQAEDFEAGKDYDRKMIWMI